MKPETRRDWRMGVSGILHELWIDRRVRDQFQAPVGLGRQPPDVYQFWEHNAGWLSVSRMQSSIEPPLFAWKLLTKNIWW